LDTERNAARWQRTAQGLRSFYVSNGIYSEALPLDKKVHARLDTTASAVTLAETQLAMDLNAEASAVLEAIDAGKATAASHALLGVALARNGNVEEARRLAKAIEFPEKASPGTLYSVARLYGEIGNADEALRLLKRTFESIAPSRLEGFKNHARESREFATLASTAAFAEVLETKSKIAESKCSSGNSCSGCPMRGKCPSSGDR
jgi:tetratricopeptide (TPR) repeat protein